MSSETKTSTDGYLDALEEPERSTLQTLRRTILEIVPEAEEVISYGLPAFRARGETIAGFAAFKQHLSYLPFSGSVLGELAGRARWLRDDHELAALRRRPATLKDARAEANQGSAG